MKTSEELKPKEVASQFGIRLTTLHQWDLSGKFVARRYPNRCKYYLQVDVDAQLNKVALEGINFERARRADIQLDWFFSEVKTYHEYILATETIGTDLKELLECLKEAYTGRLYLRTKVLVEAIPIMLKVLRERSE